MAKESEVRFEGFLPTTPADTWAAITADTGGWLWPIRYEPRDGGAECGLTPNGGMVTVWKPSRRFVTYAEDGKGWFNTLEYVLEPKDGGTYLRFEHNTVLEDWDVEYDACEQHTAFYYHSLGEYLTHFNGRQARYFKADAPEASIAPEAFEAVLKAVGAKVADEKVDFEVPGVGTVEGVVDYLTSNFLGVRTEDALYRFYGRNVWGWPVGLAHHLFAEDADADKAEKAWTAWLTDLYT
ncbi:SRPBCC family protein [Amycolatopsis pittospori]|uniref:SRPBCC domain-containing protein n=1 Tax=Amycolatopsis pittospori TaxID=2749434 RepID=UPI0015F0411E|nr:SRPBCC domain-containing protein [Amycolatopsis pittospori]